MGLLADIGRVLIKLDEPKSGHIPNKETKTIIRLLKFIAEGGLYGGCVAILGIGLASFYTGWLGMAVIMLVFGILLYVFGNKQLSSILSDAGVKKKIAWERYSLGVGFLLIAIALMGLMDSISIQIPRPSPDPNWAAEGLVGFVLIVVSLLYIRFRRKRENE